MPTDEDYFPIGVWLQRPGDAIQWKAAGVNLYNGLWQGPTVSQLEMLRAAEMQAIVSQNSTGLNYTASLSDGKPVIVGWLLDDEPDNAQPNGSGGYGPPIPTSTVQQEYQQVHTNDPTRPVFLNLGQGIAWDSAVWIGQGGGIDPDTDYPQYILGSDIICFDIYPMDSSRSQTAGDAWRVALGVDRLRQYAPANHIIWCFIETGDISANGKQATVAQMRAEVWMALIHGATGINYFIHGKSSISNFDDKALLRPENADRLAGFTAINQEVHSLAAIVKSDPVVNQVTMTNVAGSSPVDFTVRQKGDATYVFAVGMRATSTTKKFTFQNLSSGEIEVLGEDRTLPLVNGSFTDTFTGYEAHLYRVSSHQVRNLKISFNPSTVQLSWDAKIGVSYSVKYKINLDQNPWMDLGTIIGTDAAAVYTDNEWNDNSHRFYRVTIP